ncbi:hypothetical protein [Chromobacterium piscinae]|uniref:hypothetical protein n=1 Tax=Chromobacterium piscinae TaxID=686831 RepID=UPI0032604C84
MNPGQTRNLGIADIPDHCPSETPQAAREDRNSASTNINARLRQNCDKSSRSPVAGGRIRNSSGRYFKSLDHGQDLANIRYAIQLIKIKDDAYRILPQQQPLRTKSLT